MLPAHKLLIFTGPIDAFYASQGMEKLEYRSIYFEVRKYFLKPANTGFENTILSLRRHNVGIFSFIKDRIFRAQKRVLPTSLDG